MLWLLCNSRHTVGSNCQSPRSSYNFVLYSTYHISRLPPSILSIMRLLGSDNLPKSFWCSRNLACDINLRTGLCIWDAITAVDGLDSVITAQKYQAAGHPISGGGLRPMLGSAEPPFTRDLQHDHLESSTT